MNKNDDKKQTKTHLSDQRQFGNTLVLV